MHALLHAKADGGLESCLLYGVYNMNLSRQKLEACMLKLSERSFSQWYVLRCELTSQQKSLEPLLAVKNMATTTEYRDRGGHS